MNFLVGAEPAPILVTTYQYRTTESFHCTAAYVNSIYCT